MSIEPDKLFIFLGNHLGRTKRSQTLKITKSQALVSLREKKKKKKVGGGEDTAS